MKIMKCWVTAWAFVAVATIATSVQAKTAHDSRSERLEAALQAAQADGFHGVVLVTKGEDIVLAQGYGYANEATKARFTPNSVVQIGSGVKDFTKIAIFQLEESGKLSLSDTLDRFFDGVPADKRGITIQQLLDHRAGLPLGFDGGDRRGLTHDDLLKETFALKLASASAPDAQQSYSNVGYSLLAAIVEKIGGQPFDLYVRDYILKPLGLRDTGSQLVGFDPSRVAHGYASGKDIGSVLDMPHDDTGHLYQLRGNGGYVSTLADMSRFYAAIAGPQLIKVRAHRRSVFDEGGMQVLAGSDTVSYFFFANYPGLGYRVLLATNHAEYPAPKALKFIEGVLGVGPPPGTKLVTTGPGESGGRQPDAGPLLATFPDSAAGRTVAAYFTAYNSGNDDSMKRYFAEYAVTGPDSPPIETRIARYHQTRTDMGALTIVGVRVHSNDPGITVTAKTERDDQVSFDFRIEANPPNRLLGIQVQLGN